MFAEDFALIRRLFASFVFDNLSHQGEMPITIGIFLNPGKKEVAYDQLLFAECLGGAMYQADFIDLSKRVGFGDPRQIETAPISIQNDDIQRRVGAARFSSVTLRLLKLEGLDHQCEDYGQVATYRGGIPGCEVLFRLDDHHLFEAGRPERVCGNTAAMLSDTRFGRFFSIQGDTSVHYGVYPCDPTMAAREYADRESEAGGGCC